MVGFHLDEEGDWVAHLACGHTQHVRHRPPFQERPWVVDEGGRRERIGAPLECPLCDRGELPDGLDKLRSTPTWDAETMPAGLRSEHRLAAGIWALLVVEEGEVRFRSRALAGGPLTGGTDVTVVAGGAQAVPPEAPHTVELGPGTRFHLDILRVPPPPEPEGGESACYAHLLCPDCGVVLEPGARHRPGCTAPPPVGPVP